MAIDSGYFDSVKGDRRYSAETMCSIFEGTITDGVYASVGEKFAVTPGEGLQVLVGTGRAWFHEKWARNRAKIALDVALPDPVFERIDTVALVVDNSDAVRMTYVEIFQGAIGVTAAPPTLTDTDEKFHLKLAHVHVKPAATSITPSNIDILVGTSVCPFVTSILQQTNIDMLFANWTDQFMTWWDGIKTILDGDTVGNLLNEIGKLNEDIDNIDNRITTMSAAIPSSADLSDITSDNKYITPVYFVNNTASFRILSNAQIKQFTSSGTMTLVIPKQGGVLYGVAVGGGASGSAGGYNSNLQVSYQYGKSGHRMDIFHKFSPRSATETTTISITVGNGGSKAVPNKYYRSSNSATLCYIAYVAGKNGTNTSVTGTNISYIARGGDPITFKTDNSGPLGMETVGSMIAFGHNVNGIYYGSGSVGKSSIYSGKTSTDVPSSSNYATFASDAGMPGVCMLVYIPFIDQ